MKVIDILLVEDSDGDVRLIREALKEAKLKNNLFAVRNGIEAMDFLQKNGKYSDSVEPDLILLDLNLPKMEGREVLSEIKKNQNLKHIPVIILTASNMETDIFSSYGLHANCYIIKPLDIGQFINIVKSVENFWFTIVKLPGCGE